MKTSMMKLIALMFYLFAALAVCFGLYCLIAGNHILVIPTIGAYIVLCFCGVQCEKQYNKYKEWLATPEDNNGV